MKQLFVCVLTLCFFSCDPALHSAAKAIETKRIDQGLVGEAAGALLRSSVYSTLHLEIQFAPGMRPQARSIDNLVSFLKTYLDKPGGITVGYQEVDSIRKAKINTQDAARFSDKHRVTYTKGQQITLYLYFSEAQFTSFGVGGIAFRNTSILILPKTIRANSSEKSVGSLVRAETGVLLHEAGHLLGLVNHGTPMVTPHQDIAHKFHCNNRNCLMYYAMEGSGLMKATASAVPGLDAACIKDLKGLKAQ